MLRSGTFVRKKFNKLLIAGLLGWFISIAGSMADSVIAGVFIGETAVSAVALITPIYSIIYAISLPIGVGGGSLFSTYSGAFKTEKAQKSAFQSLFCSVIIGIVMFIVLLTMKNTFLGFYSCSPEIMAMASDYYDAFIWIGLILPVFWAVYYLVFIDGDEKLILVNDIMMAVSNAAISLLLVNSIGVKGLGLGTLTGYVICFLLLIPHFFKKSNSIRFKRGFSTKDLWAMLSIGSAAALTTVYVGIIDIVMNKVIITNYGDTYLSAYTVINTLLNFAAVLICAADAAKPFNTVAYGENNPAAIRKTMRIVHRATIIICVIMTVSFEFLAPLWAGLYGITTPEVAQASLYCGRLLPLSFIFTAFVYAYISYYPSTYHVLLGNVLGISYMLVGPLVLAIPMSSLWGYTGLTWGFALTPVFAMLVWFIYVVIRKKVRLLPLLLNETDEDSVSYDIYLSSENIVEVCVKTNEFLKKHNVDSDLRNQIQLLLEETLMYVSDYNGSKKIIAEITLLVSDSKVRLITKDSGKVFDITDSNADISDFRCYVLSQLMIHTEEKNYTTSISFNRNMYIWER